MASDKGSLATEDPLTTATGGFPLPPPVVSRPNATEPASPNPARFAPLKRSRESPPTSPTSTAASAEQHVVQASPTKAARLGLSAVRSPVALTGAAALEDQRRQREEEERRNNPPGSSDNPIHSVLSALAGSATSAMSRPGNAPSASHVSVDGSPQPLPSVAGPQATAAGGGGGGGGDGQAHNDENNVAHGSNPGGNANNVETSPHSATSGPSLGGTMVTASPGPMDVDPVGSEQGPHAPSRADRDEKATASSLSYPGPLHSNMTSAPPPRGMSYPMPGHDSPGQTSGNKKHKCPYCDTEFTRHHNLKSHLLTHSQEKPFICQQCDSRFRRLHDLKRHSKLHTGEKPHICPKCNRKFARGDALARHSKGAGGCAGRRSSMSGSFADGDGMDSSGIHEGDESMSGIVYPHDESMTDDERRHLSLPSIKAPHVPSARSSMDSAGPQSRTYPPAGSLERPPGGLYPPPLPQERGAVGTSTLPGPPTATNTSSSSVPVSAGASSIYSQSGGITESPKPLSPSVAQDGGIINRQRSPSLTQQFQQQHFGRRTADRQTPPAFATSTQTGSGPGAVPHARTSSGSHLGGASDTSGNLFASDPGVWAYIQSLEDRVKQLVDSVSAIQKADSAKQAQIGLLTTDVTALKKQLQAQDGEASARQAQVGLLTAEVTELRKQLPPGREADVPAP